MNGERAYSAAAVFLGYSQDHAGIAIAMPYRNSESLQFSRFFCNVDLSGKNWTVVYIRVENKATELSSSFFCFILGPRVTQSQIYGVVTAGLDVGRFEKNRQQTLGFSEPVLLP
nr:hypothetical protein Iba_chr14dCG18820 [Ipomoea batatas]